MKEKHPSPKASLNFLTDEDTPRHITFLTTLMGCFCDAAPPRLDGRNLLPGMAALICFLLITCKGAGTSSSPWR